MKILYGVQGTGNGHISRAREMARAFKQLGASVDFVFSGRERERFFDMTIFDDFAVKRGLTFISEKGKINHLKTAIQSKPLHFLREIRDFDVTGYDVVLNDFEPVSAWAAKRQRVPVIGISHQCAFLHPVPVKGQNLLDKLVINQFAPADVRLGLHWYHFGQSILPPIIPIMPPEKICNNGEVLVYLPFESLDAVGALLGRFKDVIFNCYHPEVSQEQQHDNIVWHPLSQVGFHAHLQSCAGVIANGGFELPSEAMSIGKKLLLKPLKGQFEQESNVMTLEMMGLAHTMNTLSPNALRTWLDACAVGAVTFPNVADSIAQWVLQGGFDDPRSLWEPLWAAVQYPESVDDLVQEFAGLYGNKKRPVSVTNM
uniref:MJ1255/VC2487 family glycosyltransferase n=1 Tax=Thaumasiovibrio occultus TaxID=1891184 RepID=UPI000B34CE03|nr:MJ1255/VC2487 family glycosyltransferase [Thaumasiovibrio occultus]